MITRNKAKNNLIVFILSLMLITGAVLSWSPAAKAAGSSNQNTASNTGTNIVTDNPIVNSLRSSYDGSLANSIVGRAIWYMEYGNMVYGHSKYASTGYIDCSNFVSLVYKDFGYNITSAARNYGQVGTVVRGVSVKNGILTGAEKLRPGDIFTFQRTSYISHVAMYIGQVNGKPCIIGTTTGYPTAIGIISNFSNWYGTQFHQVRRVLPNSAYSPGGVINDRGPVIPAKYKMHLIRPVVLPKNLPSRF